MEQNSELESLPVLHPINFFEIEVDVRYIAFEKWQQLSSDANLPDTSFLLAQEHFADLAMGWNEEGLAFYLQSFLPFHKVKYPDIEEGDSLELMIDTRNVKSTSYNTRFCHHFFFLPQELNGIQAGEKTHFRTQDSHAICDSSLLTVRYSKEKKGYALRIWIPQSCLHGYDPLQSSSLGLHYRINRYHDEPQEFSVASTEYTHFAQMPALWANARLISK